MGFLSQMSNKEKSMLNPLKIFKRTLKKRKVVLQGHKCTFTLLGCNTSTSSVNYIMPSVIHFFDVTSFFYCK